MLFPRLWIQFENGDPPNTSEIFLYVSFCLPSDLPPWSPSGGTSWAPTPRTSSLPSSKGSFATPRRITGKRERITDTFNSGIQSRLSSTASTLTLSEISSSWCDFSCPLTASPCACNVFSPSPLELGLSFKGGDIVRKVRNVKSHALWSCSPIFCREENFGFTSKST